MLHVSHVDALTLGVPVRAPFGGPEGVTRESARTAVKDGICCSVRNGRHHGILAKQGRITSVCQDGQSLFDRLDCVISVFSLFAYSVSLTDLLPFFPFLSFLSLL